jgi:hypothetical protein
MNQKCEFENCNQNFGHEGPHGYELEPGLILAPYGGGEGKKSESVPVPLGCDCCNGAMRMQVFVATSGGFFLGIARDLLYAQDSTHLGWMKAERFTKNSCNIR